MKRFLAILLCIALILPMRPAYVSANDEDVLKLDNGYIEVSVSKKNGGFVVNTVEGNRLKKSDNNKKLLYHSDAYDTSFVSFRVGEGAEAKDYIFGGKYDTSSAVKVTQAAAGGDIVAVWSVDGITFTQTITLAADNANEHGMVSISLEARNNSGAAVPVQARILFDTCLGDQDYAYYQVSGGSLTNTMKTEQIITDEESLRSFYAVDDIGATMVTAYVVSSPTKAAIGHWNNLAASLFDFAPDTSLNFTNAINDYLTADSACALYYDLGTVGNGQSGSVVSYYGIYSNHTVNLENRVAINTVAPLRLELNSDKSAYVRQSEVGIADFAVTVSAENYNSDTSGDLENVILAVRSTAGLRSLNDSGQAMNGFEFDTYDPLTIPYTKMAEGSTITKTLYFQAQAPVSASYERITIGMYKDSVTTENLLGEKTVYILLPGSDGNIPKVSFVSMTPDTIYSAGTRHLYVAVTNETILSNALAQGTCFVKAYSADGKTVRDIPSDAITVTDGIADIALSNDISLALGSWYLQLEWTDDAVSNGIVTRDYQKQTSSILNFTVSDDPKYKNESYGVLAAVKYKVGSGSSQTFKYRLESFKDENAFKAFAEDKDHKWNEILLVFRGEFTGDNRYPVKDENGKIVGFRYYTAVSTKNVDPDTRETKVDNCITINNCLDFEGGTMSVYYEDYENVSQDRAMESAILTEFDGDLYTSDERSSVWTGKAGLSKLVQGQDFALIQYDQNGVRKSTPAEAITLIWPNVFSYAQTLAGMAFKLAYGQFGVMKNGDGSEIGRTIGFAASLSLSFMSSPTPEDDTAAPDTYFDRMKELWKDWRGASIYQYAYHGDRFNKLTNIDMNDSTTAHNNAEKGVAASVMVKDILFGCGQGFVGLNFTVSVTVKNLIDELPKVEGTLSINTINNWSFGMSGSCKFTDNMKMEAKLSFKSYNNIPVPDDFYFYIGGFKPGLNVDGGGVLWLTGGGGGFSNLYDTIFCTSGLPPLKLIITASFSIVQVLNGTATLTIGLTGFDLTAKDIKVMDQIEIIKKIQLGLQWYPDLKLQAGIYVSMFEKTIEGQGYIILLGKNYTDWFFEMFVRAALKVPESVPAVGGMTLVGADLGISTEKIWGAIQALCITIGVSYYWGEDSVNFGSGGDKAQPTYPNLLLSGYDGECEDFPIAHDDENNRTLYAHFGTNFEAPRGAQVLTGGDLILMDVAGVWSNLERTSHKFNLGKYNAGSNEATVVQLNYQAESLEEAKTLAKSFTVKDAQDNKFPLTFYDGNNPDTANANITWNSESKMAAYAFTVTQENLFDKNWFISTDTTVADIVLYNVLPMPELTDVSASGSIVAGGEANIGWKGSGLDELDSISFFLCTGTDPGEDAGYPLTRDYDSTGITDSSVIQSGAATLKVPAGIPSGNYYLRAVYSKDEQLNAVFYSSGTYKVTNANTPAAIGTPAVSAAGDLKYKVSIPATSDANTTGYVVTVYNKDGSETEITGLTYDKAENGATVFEIGGSYMAPVKADDTNPDSAVTGTTTFGLKGGESYIIGVTPYKLVDTDGDGEQDNIIYGAEKRTSATTLPKAVTPTAALTIDGKTLTALSDMNEGSAIPVFTTDAFNIKASFSEAVSGVWRLDSSELWTKADDDTSVVSGTFKNTANTFINIPVLSDGDHTLTLTGKASDGDSFSYSYHFTVDTTAPRLILSSPLNGSPFREDGTLTIAGVTDADAKLMISIDGGLQQKLSVTRNADGVFSETISIPDYDSASGHSLSIYAEDPNGNRTELREIFVIHPALGDLNNIELMVDGAVPGSGCISTVLPAENVALTVTGVTSDGKRFAMDPSRVYWRSFAADGNITVGDGSLSYSDYAKGFVEAMVEVSTGAYLTSSVALNSELPAGTVSVSATLGGKVTGGGEYNVGDSVTLTAAPEENYRFDGWELSGVDGLDLTSATLNFTMPDHAVSAKATFVTTVIVGDLNGDGTLDEADLTLLKDYLLGKDVTLTNSGDLNGDGSVNTLDLIHLYKYLLNNTGNSSNVMTEAPILTLSKEIAASGEDVTIRVDLSDNPGIMAMLLKISYDPALLTLTGCEDGELTKWDQNGDTVLWLGKTDSGFNGTVLDLKFHVADLATPGDIVVTLTSGNGDIGNYSEDAFLPTVTAGAVHIHEWNTPTYIWADDNSTVTAKAVCAGDATHVEEEKATTVYTVTAMPTGDKDGTGTYTATFTNALFSTQTKSVDIPATGYEYDEPTYTWADDNRTVTAKAVCKNDASHTVEETVNTVYEVTSNATCEEDGTGTYTATFTSALLSTQVKTVTLPATGHNYGEPIYTWADDKSAVTAKVVCANDDSHVITETVDTTYAVSTYPTAEKEGTGVYTAAFTNTRFSTQTKTVTIPVTIRVYGEPTYTWADDNSTVTAKAVCKDDASDVIEETVNTTYTVTKFPTDTEDGTGTYTATFTNTLFSTQTKTVTIPATGHKFGTPIYSWSDDNKTVTAKVVCQDDASLSVEETVDTTYTVLTTPGCDTDGAGIYRANFTNELLSSQSKTVTLFATGHDWGIPTYIWADDNSSVTAKAVCGKDTSHVIEETVKTVYEVTTFPTGERDGVGTYTATFTNALFSAQVKTETIPATEHTYGVPTYVWSEDGKSVTAKAVSMDDESVVVEETVSVEFVVETEATCETEGKGIYTAKFSNLLFSTQTKEEVIPATGHDWDTPTYVWSEDNSTVTARVVCKNDASHVVEETVNATYEVTTPAGESEEGTGTYTATFTNSQFSAQTKTVSIPATAEAEASDKNIIPYVILAAVGASGLLALIILLLVRRKKKSGGK
ncbi:MAG: hypothetical protein IK125_00660 [Lachnospiraceae bacterium]|nr:hypothetical protein [Lachnospiraceae bacterium]